MSRFSRLGQIGFLWGVGGVIAILISAVWRLFPVVVEALSMDLTSLQWCAVVGSALSLGYFEGYRAFHKAFSPRVVARALVVARRPRGAIFWLAPIFTMGLITATKKRLFVSWAVTIGVIGLIIWVKGLDQPWRGIVDLGVEIALTLGSGSMIYYSFSALAGRPLPVPADVPSGFDAEPGTKSVADDGPGTA